KSKEEAIEWAKRCPASDDEVIEIRQVQEMDDFEPGAGKARYERTRAALRAESPAGQG
ncbi:MAG: hypothetical protein IT336_08170, partial [Thermomicrobiales bacterium]|nr:hypothetical protein [Thermomicrobiales bacterium]